ncbi:MAG TPA: glycerophosphodiester phosphodiesterase family protein [Phycisphaerae bacterium]|nr:glycerophosphodiester phosphodiesterase family protein [Phycisphaerae bacterium]
MRRSMDLATLTFIALTLIGWSAGCTSLDDAVQGRDGSEPWPCIIQAHRGAGDLAPENTLPSFELAWRMGVVPEADVRTTRDGVIVAFHDKDFKRLVKDAPPELVARSVADLTWEEMAQLDVGAYKGPAFEGQRIPRLEAVFAAMRGRPQRWLYLDVKDVDLQRMAEMARQYRVERQVILASSDDGLIRRWKELLPTSRTLLWMGGTQTRLNERLRKLRETNFAGVTQLQVHVNVGDLNGPEPFDPPAEFIRTLAAELEQRGILFQVLPRNTRDPAAYTKLLELGVDSFATDDPKVALQAAKAFRNRR